MDLTPKDWRSLDYEDLAARVQPRILDRGREYLRRGQVAGALIDGNRLAASVLGTSGWYGVKIVLAESGLEAACSCPYQGPFCKHAAAVVLWWLAAPDSFLDIGASLSAKTHGELLHICRELAAAAPAQAAALLANETPRESTAAAAVLARNIARAVDHGCGGRQDLVERLEWVAARLAAAMAAGDREAAEAAMDLVESLMSAWEAKPDGCPPIQAISACLGQLAAAWPASLAGDPAIVARLAALFRQGVGAFHGELGLLAARAGLGNGEGSGLSQAGREILALLEAQRASIKAVSFFSLLALIEAYERLGRRREAAALARDGLRRPDESERYVLRQRLARYHQEAGESRQALAYLTANFKARPDVENWSALRQTAAAVGEWERLKTEILRSALNGPESLRIRAALDEGDKTALARLARTVNDLHDQAPALRLAMAEFAPDEALVLLTSGVRVCLEHGGRQARRLAAEYLKAIGKVCRCYDWHRRWQEIRSSLRQDHQSALTWPELGALLTAEWEEEGGGRGL